MLLIREKLIMLQSFLLIQGDVLVGSATEILQIKGEHRQK